MSPEDYKDLMENSPATRRSTPPMDWALALQMPTSVEIPEGSRGVHESMFRSYQVLIFVHWLISEGCPASILKYFIEEAGYSV